MWQTRALNNDDTNFMELSPSWEALSCAGTQNFRNVMESEGSLPSSQQSYNGLPGQSSPYHPIIYVSLQNPSQYHPLTYVLVLLMIFFLLAFPPIYCMHSSSPNSCYILWPSHPPLLDHSNCTRRRAQIMKLLNMQLSPTSRHFTSLRSKYSPQHPFSLYSSLNVRHKFRTNTEPQATS
jgi:hypothetical protein